MGLEPYCTICNNLPRTQQGGHGQPLSRRGQLWAGLQGSSKATKVAELSLSATLQLIRARTHAVSLPRERKDKCEESGTQSQTVKTGGDQKRGRPRVNQPFQLLPAP